jgi:hypothetical protein
MRGDFGAVILACAVILAGEEEKYHGEDRLVRKSSERRVNDRAQEFASGDWFESSLEGDFAGLENFESAAAVGVAGEFQKDREAAGRKLLSGGGVAEEFVVDEDFGAVGIRGNSDRADAIRGGR